VSQDLESVTRVRAADVYKAGVLAGQLRRVESGLEFRYHPGYLTTDRPPVATTLPLTETPTRTTGGAVPPFFAGLLPEGRRLSALHRALKTSVDDELSLVLAVGRDTVGDVQVVPQGHVPVPADPLVRVSEDWTEVRFADLMAEAGIIDPVGTPGVQDKASARMIAVPVARAGERYILKLDPPEFPHVVENEAFFLDLARRVRLPAARGRVVRDADDRPGLLVLRFDREPLPDGSARALACEDACQVLGRWPADKYLASAEEVVTALAERCAARPVALLALFRQLCFAWLTGNGDQHAKNLAILATPGGEWRASPAYDVPTTVPYGDISTALTIGGRDRGLTRRHLLAFAEAVGLPARAAVDALDDLVGRLEGLPDEIAAGALPFAQKTTADLAAELRYRLRQATV
jgi:serine/threonine-protein kinase HipA